LSVRNVGNGIVVLHGWRLEPSAGLDTSSRPDIGSFRRLTRDLYISSSEVGFWQGVIRNEQDPDQRLVVERVAARERIVIDLLYGDHLGGQRLITRFSLLPGAEDGWLGVVSRHWNVDRPDPR
jgi:hypothetical protein